MVIKMINAIMIKAKAIKRVKPKSHLVNISAAMQPRLQVSTLHE